ncbi:hypothetical protein FH972_022505 [Carpinus fangiana]|uniref:Uncharacterized protein n=1 Tax=Carpinus fangiana TaxID=176857 RepID=A0A5N6KSF6_9ROSI|nr:hypothetical protein FH972_022505 [Carpinus fangiana]
MERGSPIKSWMQKHSPIKSRNKPLPVPPRQAEPSPTRKPIAQISGNARPDHISKNDKPRRRLGSLFRSTDKLSAAQPPHSTKTHHYTQSAPTNDLRGLSAKVSSLEEQLKEAREQLDSFASSSRRSRHDTRPPSRGRQSRHSSAGQTEDTARPRIPQQENSRFDGIVENLLFHQQQQQQQQQQPSRFPRRSEGTGGSIHRRASADMGDAFAHYRRTLDAYEEARNECSNTCASDGDEDDGSPGSLKRKRSQVRASSWQAVQEYAAREALSRQWDRHSAPRDTTQSSTARRVASDGERPPQRLKQYHEKSLPKSPPKSPSPTPRKRGDPPPGARHRRSSSKTKNELPPEEAKDGDQGTAAVNNRPRPLSPSKRYATSPLKLLPVAEEFEWDDEVF